MDFSTHTDYDLIVVMIEDCLIKIKSNSRYPKNIGDFMPDYNLWYALKFCSPKTIWMIGNQDITGSGWNLTTLRGYHAKYEYLCQWLSQMTGVKDCHEKFSVRGDWSPGFGYNEDMIDLILQWTRYPKKVLFIDKNTGENQEYAKSKGLKYMTASDFIKKYNGAPREYTKKTPTDSPDTLKYDGKKEKLS